MPREVIKLAYNARMSAESDTGEVMLYGEIIQDMGVFWKMFFPSDKCASDFDRDIKQLKEDGARKLLVRINSPGGVVTEAVAMRSIIANAGFESITIRVEGMCASAATILATIPGAYVEIAPGSEYMIHNPWSGGWGNANELQRVVDHLRSIEKTTRSFYTSRTGKDDEQVREWMDNETWFTAKEAVEYGFCDAISAEGAEEMPAVACVSGREMEAMKAMYLNVPACVTVREEKAEETAENNVSHADPVAGTATEINNEEGMNMDIKDISRDQLNEQNPGLMNAIREETLKAERARCQDIDALCPPNNAEYQQMAEDAKRNGTSAMDFQKAIVAKMKQQGPNFMAARAAETAPAQNVGGGEPSEGKTEDQQIEENAKEIARYAEAYAGNKTGGMF